MTAGMLSQDSLLAVIVSILLLVALRFVAKLRLDGKALKLAQTQAKESSLTSFTYPRFKPCVEPIQNVQPVPYRPFRWGKYHITMGIVNADFDSWIELDNQYEMYHALRLHRTKKLGARVIDTLPAEPGYDCSPADAAKELVYELSEYLVRRYPLNFSVERHPVEKSGAQGWYGEGAIKTITIKEPVTVTYNLEEEDPMTVAGLLVQDDLTLMIKGPNDMYYLRAAAICTAGFWRLEDKIGMSIDEIHVAGNVPQYPQKLQKSLNRFFTKLPVDKMVRRNNYYFQTIADPSNPVEPLDPHEIAWAETTVGAEDTFKSGSGLYASYDKNKIVPPDQLRMRMERQTLRRLPKTGAIIFTIRTYVVPVEELVKEKGIPGRMASAIRSWPDDIAEYKTRESWEHIFLPYFDECHRKQIEAGLLGADEQPRTDYPF